MRATVCTLCTSGGASHYFFSSPHIFSVPQRRKKFKCSTIKPRMGNSSSSTTTTTTTASSSSSSSCRRRVSRALRSEPPHLASPGHSADTLSPRMLPRSDIMRTSRLYPREETTKAGGHSLFLADRNAAVFSGQLNNLRKISKKQKETKRGLRIMEV